MDENTLITFLEKITSSDFDRILLRLPEAAGRVPVQANHIERVFALISYVRSSAGPGIPHLIEIVEKLYPKVFPAYNSAFPMEVLDAIAKAERTGATTLDLSGYGLTTLPESITSLTTLTILDLSNNNLTTLPESIAHLTNLTNLYLMGNSLTSLPESITQLTHLNYLNLSRNGLTSLPESITRLTRLTTLDLVNNSLTTLPESITGLTTLTNLYLGYNYLTSLPESITQLTRLNYLDLRSNRLTSLPESITRLTTLTTLDLSNNNSTSLPESITRLTRLTELALNDNRLTSLPESITRLTTLTTLDLRGNRLTSLPESITRLTTLTTLDLRDNPELKLPPEIMDDWRNAPRILAYLAELYQTQETLRPMNEVKVILVGEAKTGKTSLIKRLTRNEFDPYEPKTDGIDIHHWDLVGVRCAKGEGDTEEVRTVRLNIWDLGGQEIYHATHQFFLTERTLYLLVLSARSSEEQNRLHYWLKTIRALGKDAPILIVHNHHETNPEQLDRKSLREKYPTISPDGFIETSCTEETLKGIDTLREAIRREIGRMSHVSDPLPHSYFQVKERLEKETETRDFVSGEEYETLCAEAGVTEPAMQSGILSLLHALGTVVSFQDDLRLSDTNVLNPEWVTEGVYSVLDDPNLKMAGDGLLRGNALPEILKNAKRRYPRSKHHFILDMMEKFELSFKRPGSTQEYLIPELLNKSEPEDTGSFADVLRFELQYDFLPQSILPRFIVRTSHLLQPYRWRKGVVIEHEGNRALVRADTEANRVTIAVAGHASTRRDLLSVIRDHFSQIHQTPETLKVDELIPLVGYPNAKPVPYKHLLQLENQGISELHWLDVLPDKPAVAELLNGIEPKRHPGISSIKPLPEKDENMTTPTQTPPTRINLVALLERTELLNVAPDNAYHLKELADRTEKGRVVPFVGAGMTIPLGMPGWGEALDAIYNSAKPNLSSDDGMRYGLAKATNHWEEAAQALWDVKTLGERWFNAQIRSLFGKHRLLSKITGSIALIPKFAHGPILTTNFDAALEKVYADAGQPFTSDQTILGDYRADSVINDWDEGKRFLLKLHGDADESSGRVLTYRQYERAYGEGSKLPELLRALFGSRRPLLFLGCSLLTDRTLNELKTAGLQQTNSYHFALLQSPGTPEERQKRQNELVAQYGIQAIWFAPGDFAAIERVLQFLADVYVAKS